MDEGGSSMATKRPEAIAEMTKRIPKALAGLLYQWNWSGSPYPCIPFHASLIFTEFLPVAHLFPLKSQLRQHLHFFFPSLSSNLETMCNFLGYDRLNLFDITWHGFALFTLPFPVYLAAVDGFNFRVSSPLGLSSPEFYILLLLSTAWLFWG